MESIEIILKKDSEGNEINLNHMSLKASKSLRQILDALILIAEHEKDLNLKIGLEKGSAAHKLIGTHTNLKVVYNKIIQASECQPTRENIYVNQLNVIRNNVEDIQDWEIYYNSNTGTKESIKPLFSQKFRKTRKKEKIENNFNLQFITGYLELNGGRKPNFHLISNDEPITIQCSRKEAQKVNPFLYKDVKIATWAKAKKHGMEYQFCDIYTGDSEKYFIDFQDFFSDLKTKIGTEPFHFISEKLEGLYDSQDYSGAKKFIRLFLNEYSLPTYLRTILVISKGFKNDEYLSEILNKVEQLLSTKIGKVY
ncbi:hypothetical protein AX016_1205 [Cellulophaga sp. RHA19]|uniref:hypothetical protein n=1 Tax=Cellulophaga sp. RHA19 TaxID=1798237 RepID=UPI000C2CAB2C|nr:hypothetical protein [Cellulophaga sp. RHA19]PKB43025.1 hypothetical protein AX016_1205 [Cellulophaga sp. RHA19]